MIVLTLVVALPFIVVGSVMMYFTLVGLYSKSAFKAKAKKVEGKVVGKIPGVYEGYKAINESGLTENVPSSSGGYFMYVEYEVDGKVWTARTEKTYLYDKESLPVLYDPDDPSNVVIDDYYDHTSGQRIFYLVMSLVFIVLIPCLIFYILMSSFNG